MQPINQGATVTSICAVCRLMSGYVPALKQTIQCFHCERRIYPSGGQSYPASGQNQDQSMGERNYRKKKRRKRPKFRLTMPREDPDDFEIISMASPTTSNENQFYQPDTPESENSFRGRRAFDDDEDVDYNDNGSKKNKCYGCGAIRFGKWVECSKCMEWRCDRCVPNIADFEQDDAVYNCELCQ